MPYLIPRPRIRRHLCAMLGATMLAAAVPAAAQACSVATAGESQVFAGQGDHAYYTTVPGTSFAGGTTGWSLLNATLSSALAPLVFNGATNAQSLQIRAGGTAVSPPICVSSATPTFRFFALGPVGVTSLNVQLLWTDALGIPHESPVGMLLGNGSWRASPALLLGAVLPLWMPGSTLTVRLQFQATGFGNWAINQIYVDPYTRS